jgi:predicted permease
MGTSAGMSKAPPVRRSRISPSRDCAKAAERFSQLFAFAPLARATVNIDGVPDLVSGQLVSGNYYGALKVPALAGRVITEADDGASSQAVAVISQRYWQRRFALDPGVIGKNIVLNGVPVVIVGVSAAGFNGVNGFGTSADFSIPLAFEPQLRANPYMQQPWTWWLRLMGRVSANSTIEQVRAELEGMFQATALEGWNAAPAPLRGSIGGDPDTPRLRIHEGRRGMTDTTNDRTARLLSILMSVFGLLLLIVCVNIANLLLARSAARRQEIAVRQAIGAERARIIRQLLTESVLNAAVAGALGIVLAYWGKDLLAAFLPDRSRMELDLRIDLPILVFASAASLLSGVLFGIAPAMRAALANVYGVIKETSRIHGRGRSRLGKGLLVVQVAMSVVLLTGEIGIRMALGAQRAKVVWLVLRETLLLIVIGAAIGSGASFGLTRLVARNLFGLAPHDPAVITVALSLLIAVAAFAGYLPARRASHIDPMWRLNRSKGLCAFRLSNVRCQMCDVKCT